MNERNGVSNSSLRLGDIIDKFRNKQLNLSELHLRKGPSVVDTLKVPWTYCMSPALVPKPDDWKSHIGSVTYLMTWTYFLIQLLG
jgi:hypothetical protein